jgi:hypothetical protein
MDVRCPHGPLNLAFLRSQHAGTKDAQAGGMLSESSPDLDGVVLVRLLVRPKKFTLAALAADVRALLCVEDAPAARRAAEEALVRLKGRGLIWPDTKFILTDNGESAALQELGLSQSPKRQPLDWRRAKKLLILQRFRLTAGAFTLAGKADHLAAWVINHKERLSLRQPATPGAVLRAMAWRALGLPDSGPFGGSAALGALLGLARQTAALSASPAPAREPPDAGKSSEAPPVLTLSVQGADPLDLATFGRKVNELALSAKEGRWVGDKVFIAQVWKDFKRQRGAGDVSLERFKLRLTEAARGGHVLLSRADVMASYPHEALQQSQIEADGELYHFVETQHLR